MLHRLVCLAHSGLHWTRPAGNDRLDHLGSWISGFMVEPVPGIPEKALRRAKWIAVLRHLLKGGLVFGRENGRGSATRRTARAWSTRSPFVMSGASSGIKSGIECADLEMIIEEDRRTHRSSAPIPPRRGVGPLGRRA